MSAISSFRSTSAVAHGSRSCRCAKCMGSSAPAATKRPVVARSSAIVAAAHTSAANCKCPMCVSPLKAGRTAARTSTIAMATPAAPTPNSIATERISKLLVNNKQWASAQVKYDPSFFNRLRDQQTPEYLWIGCADSRVPANVIVGLDPGEVFVQRNVGNQASHTDMNVQACIEFAVKALKVKTIIVCGHSKCGAVKAALTLPSKTAGLVNCWISDIREARNQHLEELKGLSEDEQLERLVEFNVLRQTFHVCTSAPVQEAWDNGIELNVYGMYYTLEDGVLEQLVGPITSNDVLGTTDQEVFVTQSLQKKGASGGKGKEPALVGAAKPAANTEKLAMKLATHVAWEKGEI